MEINIYKWMPVIIAALIGGLIGCFIHYVITKNERAPGSFGSLIIAIPKHGFADMYMQLNIEHTIEEITKEKAIVLDVVVVKD